MQMETKSSSHFGDKTSILLALLLPFGTILNKFIPFTKYLKLGSGSYRFFLTRLSLPISFINCDMLFSPSPSPLIIQAALNQKKFHFSVYPLGTEGTSVQFASISPKGYSSTKSTKPLCSHDFPLNLVYLCKEELWLSLKDGRRKRRTFRLDIYCFMDKCHLVICIIQHELQIMNR